VTPSKKRAGTARFAIVRARFNTAITQALLDGALRAFAAAGVNAKRIRVIEVPGAFELPVAALWLARSKKYAAIVALGCVIRGETPHFEYVAGAATRGLSDVAVRTGVPIAFGVLTTENEAQARARAGAASVPTPEHRSGKPGGNKGYEAAEAAMVLANVRKTL
jgi:6,7-dimethyl-8-ribityllumazine synthase